MASSVLLLKHLLVVSVYLAVVCVCVCLCSSSMTLTKPLGVEALPEVVRGQRVHGQDALVGEVPLAAGNEHRQELAVRRDVTAGVVIDLALWNQHIHGACTHIRS